MTCLMHAAWRITRDPTYISGTRKARNFTFGTEIDRKELYRKYAKLGQKES